MWQYLSKSNGIIRNPWNDCACERATKVKPEENSVSPRFTVRCFELITWDLCIVIAHANVRGMLEKLRVAICVVGTTIG
jgi:hypothetical protein